jgi:hypothetical protein
MLRFGIKAAENMQSLQISNVTTASDPASAGTQANVDRADITQAVVQQSSIESDDAPEERSITAEGASTRSRA